MKITSLNKDEYIELLEKAVIEKSVNIQQLKQLIRIHESNLKSCEDRYQLLLKSQGQKRTTKGRK